MANEIHEQDRVAHNDAGKRDEADHGRGREGRTHEPMAQHDSDEDQRRRDKDHERQAKRAELGDSQQADPENRDGEGSAPVTKSHIGHFPFAVPRERRLRFIERLTVVAMGRILS